MYPMAKDGAGKKGGFEPRLPSLYSLKSSPLYMSVFPPFHPLPILMMVFAWLYFIKIIILSGFF